MGLGKGYSNAIKTQSIAKKARYAIQQDCDHNVANQPAGTMCACAKLLSLSKANQ